jgi:hypothetical protein
VDLRSNLQPWQAVREARLRVSGFWYLQKLLPRRSKTSLNQLLCLISCCTAINHGSAQDFASS